MPLAKYFLSRYVEIMPANMAHKSEGDNLYFHVYNRGVDGKIIFKDNEDYSMFLGFLQEYLSPSNPEESKKEFIVNGRGFQGIPHQPKNYFGKIELIAYSLNTNHFHLVLRQVEAGSLVRFMRSLSTRYSIYFNKKYQRRGSLFEGPYKSVAFSDLQKLSLLTCYLHQEKGYSSLPEFLGTRITLWVKPDAVTSSLTNYQEYFESYKLDENNKQLLEGIVIDNISDSNNPSHTSGTEEEKPIIDPVPKTNIKPRTFEYFTLSAVFIVLIGLGLLNIQKTQAQEPQNHTAQAENPEVLSDSTESNQKEEIIILQTPQASSSPNEVDATPSSTPSPQPLGQDNVVQIGSKVKISDGPDSVTVQKDPSLNSEIISYAIFGEIFEIFDIKDGWYEIKLANGSSGFIQSIYTELVNNNI